VVDISASQFFNAEPVLAFGRGRSGFMFKGVMAIGSTGLDESSFAEGPNAE
jgi:hypothetical protein